MTLERLYYLTAIAASLITIFVGVATLLKAAGLI